MSGTMTDDLVERVALRNCKDAVDVGRPCRTACPPCKSNAREAVRIALEEAAKVAEREWFKGDTNPAAAIRALIKN